MGAWSSSSTSVDGSVHRRERTVAAFAAVVALVLGVAVPPAAALGGLGGLGLPGGDLIESTLAVLDPALEETLDQSTQQIQAAAVWDEPRPAGEPQGYTGRGIGAAVIDSGIDGLHPGVAYPDVTVQNVRPVGFKDVGTGTPVWAAAVEDVPVTDVTSGHGSHVAGIIAGRGTESGQYRGVAPGAHLIGLGASDDLEMLTILQSYAAANRSRSMPRRPPIRTGRSWRTSGTSEMARRSSSRPSRPSHVPTPSSAPRSSAGR